MTDQELYKFAQSLLPFHRKECPECEGEGRRYVSYLKIMKDRCRCGGTGLMMDNIWWMSENGYDVSGMERDFMGGYRHVQKEGSDVIRTYRPQLGLWGATEPGEALKERRWVVSAYRGG